MTTAPISAIEFTCGTEISGSAFWTGVTPSFSQARWNRTFARATEPRIWTIFSSSCSMKGFGTRKRRWRSSPGTIPWRRSARTTLSGRSSHSGLICRPSKSRRTSLHGPRRSAIVSSYSGPRLDERVPLEVLQREPSPGRARRRGAAWSALLELLGAVGRRVGVLRPGQAERLVARVREELLPRDRERLRVEAVEGVVAVGRADALPDGVEGRRRGVPGRRRGGGARPEASLLRDPRADAVDEDRQLLHVLRAVREPLPRAVAGRVGAGEGDERDPPDAAREEELEGVDRVLHDGPLVDAAAEPVERLADEAREGERGVERAAEVGPLDAERGQLVGRLRHEVAPFRHVGRRAPEDGERALERGEGPVLREGRRGGDEPGGEVREDLAGPHAVRADLVRRSPSSRHAVPVEAPNMSIFDRPDSETILTLNDSLYALTNGGLHVTAAACGAITVLDNWTDSYNLGMAIRSQQGPMVRGRDRFLPGQAEVTVVTIFT